MEADSNAYMTGALVGALVVGILCGLLPFRKGQQTDQEVLGIVGMIVCVLSGLMLGLLLALPVGLLFRYVIGRRAASQSASTVETAFFAPDPGLALNGNRSAPIGGFSQPEAVAVQQPTQQVSEPTTPELPPANWYADPTGESRLRFWDGSVWTERVSD